MVNYLFPNKYKKLGYILFVSGVILYLLERFFDIKLETTIFKVYDDRFLGSTTWFDWSIDDISNELSIILLLLGSIFSLFSKEKVEDEFINKIRLESLVLGIYLNIGILIVTTLTIYGTFYLSAIIYSVFTYLIFSFIIFHYKLYQNKKEINNEK